MWLLGLCLSLPTQYHQIYGLLHVCFMSSTFRIYAMWRETQCLVSLYSISVTWWEGSKYLLSELIETKMYQGDPLMWHPIGRASACWYSPFVRMGTHPPFTWGKHFPVPTLDCSVIRGTIYWHNLEEFVVFGNTTFHIHSVSIISFHHDNSPIRNQEKVIDIYKL